MNPLERVLDALQPLQGVLRWAGLAAVVGGLLLVLGVLRLPGADRIRTAADAAEQQDWSTAVELLEDHGRWPASVTALYDLGVARYHQGDLPRAIGAWRAARRFAPRNPDLVHNLAVARSELRTAPPPPVPAPQAWLEVVTPGEVGLVALLAWIFAGAGALAWRAGRGALAPWTATTAVAVVLSGVALVGRSAQLGAPLVVTLEQAPARDGADLDAGERFVLPPGAELLVAARRGAFLLVEDGEGRRGWVLTEALYEPERR